MKVAALCILALSFIIGCSEAFIARRLVVSPALSTSKILATTAPQHARVTALGLLDGSKGTNKILARKAPQHTHVTALGLWHGSKGTNKIPATTAPQHARVTALWDDPKGWADVVFNAVPAALLVFVVSTSTSAQEKVLAAEKEKRREVLAAEKENLAVWKAIQEGAIATERESRKEAIAAEREDLKAALLHQNEIWSLRFENYAAKGEKIEKDD